MTVIEIARFYTDLVNLDEQIPESELLAKEEVSVLRSKYHQILMDKFKEEGIEYLDRFDATRKAFDLVKQEEQVGTTHSMLNSLRRMGT